LRFNGGFSPDGGGQPVAFSAVLRLNSQALPETVRSAAIGDVDRRARRRPYSALSLLVTTLNSSTASGGGCITWFEKPGCCAVALLSTPSIRKLLKVLRSPFTLNAPSRGVPLLPAERRLPHTGREEGQREVFAAVEWKRPRLRAADHLTALARVGLDERRRAGDRHTFRKLPEGHLKIDAHARGHLHLNVLDERHCEAGLFGGHDVDARPDGEELVVPRGVRRFRAGDAGRGVGQRDRGAWNDGAGCVVDGADDGTGIELGVGDGGTEAEQDRKQTAATKSHSHFSHLVRESPGIVVDLM
jgi:hypothetical protein